MSVSHWNRLSREGAGWLAVSLSLGLLASTVGCGKKRRHGSSAPLQAVRCDLPQEVLSQIKTIKQVLDATEDQKRRWMKAILGKCRTWPLYVRQAISVMTPPDPNGSILLSGTPIWAHKDYKRDARALCPSFFQKPMLGKDPFSEERRARLLRKRWRRCDLGKTGLMSVQEYIRNGALAMTAMAAYRMLLRGSMDKAVARKISRLLLIDDPVSRHAANLKISLPRSVSSTAAADGVEVGISATAVSCQGIPTTNVKNWSVTANSKRDGPDGFFIDPLFKRLKNEAKKLKLAEQQGGAIFSGNLLLLVDRRAPFRLVAEVLYTSMMAGFKQFQLAVRGPNRQLRVTPISTGTSGQRNR